MPPADLFFSEYIEGSSNNKALELYNGTGTAIDLAAGNYTIAIYFNGSSSPGTIISLSGTVANGDVFIVADNDADPAILAEADQQVTSSLFNGDDAIVLRKNGVTVDVIGQVGTDPGSRWAAGGIGTQNETLRRKATVTDGDTNDSDSFDPSVEWEGFAQDTFDGLGSHTIADGTPPTLLSITRKTPGNQTTSNDSLIFLAAFSEDVTNVDKTDFVVTGTTGTPTVTQNTAATYEVMVSGGDLANLNGIVGLNLAAGQNIADLAGNALPDREPNVDETYTVTNSAPPPLAPTAAGTLLAVTDLDSANTVSLSIEQLTSDDVSELLVFSTDAMGGSRTLIDSFSLLQGQQFSADYAPTLTLNSAQVNNGTFLQFELVQGSVTGQATVTASGDQVFLNFGNGTQLSAATTTQTAQTNLLVNDAATIDLTGQAGVVNVRFLVYREASFNNTVGFYTTDFDDGGLRDAVTGAVLNPGEPGYRAAALARQLDVALTGRNNQLNTVVASLPGGEYLGMFLVVDRPVSDAGDVYFSHAGVNSGGADHVKQLGDNMFGFEDQAGLGDGDYDDIVVAFELL